MVSIGNDPSGETPDGSPHRKRFVLAPDDGTSSGVQAGPEAATPDESDELSRPVISRMTWVVGGGLVVAALLTGVASGMITDASLALSEDTVSTANALQAERKSIDGTAAKLSELKEIDRALVTAQESAGQIARLQNDYRFFTGAIASEGGMLKGPMVDGVRRNLAPHFATDVSAAAVNPWYLLSEDASAPSGTGLPLSFDSGFAWSAQRPYLVTAEGVISVSWLAHETRPAEGQFPAILAWARANYDPVRKTFSDVEVGTTAMGEQLRQEVRAQ